MGFHCLYSTTQDYSLLIFTQMAINIYWYYPAHYFNEQRQQICDRLPLCSLSYRSSLV
ncbi:hypothetical protein FHS18_001702 [Paenibacillus phyllosphaerae]|uniref:Uncharacterized protein n=1 Tax=Paenibacillus phyllosphaerae TaxID=274593 RepID=A0A7W5AVN2_9BACL|nr:hypothetical protein [Paenibacillus phyllosphaerae]